MRHAISCAIAAAVVFLVGAGAAPALAQVCGDANGDGSVTDIDGVIVLRAAALLGDCDASVCDVNGDGQVNDLDGVLVLRKAALIPIVEQCSSVAATVSSVLEKQVIPLIGYVAGGSAIPSDSALTRSAKRARGIANAQPDSIDCTDDGTIEFDGQETLTFVGCQEDTIVANGTIRVTSTAIELNLVLTDTETQESVSFTGSVGFLLDQDNFVATLNGDITVQSNTEGGFVLTFRDLGVDLDFGDLISGSLLIDGTTPDSLGIIDRLLLVFDDSGVAPVTVTLDDGTQVCFSFDLDFLELTEATCP